MSVASSICFTLSVPKYVSTTPFTSPTMSISGNADLPPPKLNFTFSKAPKYPVESPSQPPRTSPASSIPFAGLSRSFRRSFAKPAAISTAATSDHQDGEISSLNRDVLGDFSSSANHDGSGPASLPDSHPAIADVPPQDTHAPITSASHNDLRFKGSSIMQERILRLKQQRESDGGPSSQSGSLTAPSWQITASSHSKPIAQPRSTSAEPTNGDSSMSLDQVEIKPLSNSANNSGASFPHNILPLQTDPLLARLSASASPLPAFASSPGQSATQLSVFADALRSAESWMLENQKMVRISSYGLESYPC